ncbi:DUF2155 domain-containing protein [Albirhodobacter sp. R86504]|uniref:DUF2155 domain-containing protein n=1 Tax=Albirhodobacter sp. R86504 TaxID=3093848 RepID=UPI003670B0B6
MRIGTLGLVLPLVVGFATGGFAAAVSANGAHLRALDKISGVAYDIDLKRGETVAFKQLTISLHDCRYPSEDPTSNAYASLTIQDDVQRLRLFDGWMIADSPALSALDHHRYDVWVVRCDTP